MPALAPHAVASPPPLPGAGRMDVARVDGASAVVGLSARAPLHLLVPRPRGLAAWAYLSTFGGGLVAGDTVSLAVNVGPAARALLSTQASTKVYRSEGPSARQHLEARVDEGALLAVLPDPVVCFAGAVYAQRQRFDLAPGASLLFVDGLSAGRSARNERWRFASYRSVTEIHTGGRLLAREALVLEDEAAGSMTAGPGAGSIAARLGRFDALAFAVLLGPHLEETARAIVTRLAHLGARHDGLSPAATAAFARRPSLLASASPIAGGAVIRVAAEHPEEIANFLRNLFETISTLLGDDPWARKG
jgi:urease accessory protein